MTAELPAERAGQLRCFVCPPHAENRNQSSTTVYMTPKDRNPYQGLLQQELQKLGMVVEVGTISIRKALLANELIDAKILHLHWLQPLYVSASFAKSWLKSHLFLHCVRKFKASGGKVVWTVHNLFPHEMQYPAIDKWVRERMHTIADAVIVHGEEAKEDYINLFGNTDCLFVISHGLYPVSLVPLPDSDLSRQYFGIPKEGKIIALQFGRAREYKGYDRVLKAAKALKERGIHVVFAGQGYEQELGTGVTGVTVLPHFIQEYQLPVLFSAAGPLPLLLYALWKAKASKCGRSLSGVRMP